jgi:putative peptide zinc metalloprotease protein
LVGDVTTAPDAVFDQRWSPAPGLVFLGPVQGSGLKDRAYLLQRGDGQIVQLSELLNLVMVSISAEKSLTETAREISDAYGRELGESGLRHLLDTRLAPLGLVRDVAASSGSVTAPPTANPLP